MSRFLRLLIVCALAFPTLACGEDDAPPRPQWLVVVSTDALIPLMGDRLLVELLDEYGEVACTSCRRQAEVAPASKWPVSFGIASPAEGGEVVVRVQLYRGDRIDATGRPRRESSIDFVGMLPPLQDGVNQVGVHLVVDCLGVAADLPPEGFASCVSPTREKGSPRVLGPPTDHGPCGGTGTTQLMPDKSLRSCPEAGSALYENGRMACIPGGLFFLGDPLAPVPAKDVQALTSPERLAAVRSFLMDRHEVTVGEFRDHLQKEGKLPLQGECPKGVTCGEGESVATRKLHCTYRTTEMSAAELVRPINCVSWQQACEYCRAQGKRLPSEVEWEYAATNGMLTTRYPWGDDPPRCTSTFVARGVAAWQDDTFCLTGGAIGPASPSYEHDETLSWGPLMKDQGGEALKVCNGVFEPPVGLDPQDHTVFALAGNLSEWTSHPFFSYDKDACWNPERGLFLDYTKPVIFENCELVEATEECPWERVSLRGGSWRDPLDATWSASRNSASPVLRTPQPEIGFRCVGDLEP